MCTGSTGIRRTMRHRRRQTNATSSTTDWSMSTCSNCSMAFDVQRLVEAAHVADARRANPGFLVTPPARAPKIKAKKITVSPEPHITHHLQKPSISRTSATSNQIGSSNRAIKCSSGVDLHNSSKRLGRGRPFQTPAVALAIAAENVRRIITGIEKFCADSMPKPPPITRAKRRPQSGGAYTAAQVKVEALPGI